MGKVLSVTGKLISCGNIEGAIEVLTANDSTAVSCASGSRKKSDETSVITVIATADQSVRLCCDRGLSAFDGRLSSSNLSLPNSVKKLQSKERKLHYLCAACKPRFPACIWCISAPNASRLNSTCYLQTGNKRDSERLLVHRR